MIDILPVIAAALISGGATGGVTIVALRVHMVYMREAIARAHARLDDVDRRLQDTREKVIQEIRA